MIINPENIPLLVIIVILLLFNIVLYTYNKVNNSSRRRLSRIINSHKCDEKVLSSSRFELPKKSLQSIMSNDSNDYNSTNKTNISLVSVADFNHNLSKTSKNIGYVDPSLKRFMCVSDGYTSM